jgi:hypothetical protein
MIANSSVVAAVPVATDESAGDTAAATGFQFGVGR